MSTDESRPVPPLALGHGPVELELFLEPTCPYSKRAFEKCEALIEAAGAERLTVQIRLLSQPWHLYSGVVTRAILAAAASMSCAHARLVSAPGAELFSSPKEIILIFNQPIGQESNFNCI